MPFSRRTYVCLICLAIFATTQTFGSGYSDIIRNRRAVANSILERKAVLRPVIIGNDLLIADHFFFSGPKDHAFQVSQIDSGATVVHENQIFGCTMLVESRRPYVDVLLTLKVPSHPENFNFHPGFVAMYRETNTVQVFLQANTIKKILSYYWGIAPEDPKGEYTITCQINGVVIEQHSFVAE